MKHNDVQDSLAAGFEPSPLPPIGPDGAVSIQPQRRLPVAPPRLCEAGPCRHYHRFTIQLDAARPIADRLGDGGQLEGEAPAQPFHVEVHHYCYPTVGVESGLGSLPVMACNLWEPRLESELAEQRAREDAFFATDQGQAHLRELSAWQAAQREGEDAAVAAADDINDLPNNEGAAP